MTLEQLGIHMWKNCLSILILHQTQKLKCITDLNVKATTIKLEENTEENLSNVRISNDFLDKTKSKNIKENLDKLGLEIVNLCSLKETIKKMNLPAFPGRNLATSSEEAPDYGQSIVTVVDWPGCALNFLTCPQYYYEDGSMSSCLMASLWTELSS